MLAESSAVIAPDLVTLACSKSIPGIDVPTGVMRLLLHQFKNPVVYLLSCAVGLAFQRAGNRVDQRVTAHLQAPIWR